MKFDCLPDRTTSIVAAAMCIEYLTIRVLAESEKYLTLELLTANLLTLDRTKFVIYQQEDVHIDVLLYKQEFFLLRQTILGTRTVQSTVLG